MAEGHDIGEAARMALFSDERLRRKCSAPPCRVPTAGFMRRHASSNSSDQFPPAVLWLRLRRASAVVFTRTIHCVK